MQYRSTWCKAVAHDFGIFWDSRSIHIQHRFFQDTRHKKRPDFGILFVASILISNLKPVSMNFAALRSAKSATHRKFGETGGLPTAPFCRAEHFGQGFMPGFASAKRRKVCCGATSQTCCFGFIQGPSFWHILAKMIMISRA